MAQTSTLYRFQIELSDISRGVYETLAFRTPMHPSESSDFLLTRVIAYALNLEDGLEFSPQGLGDSDIPPINKAGQNGNYDIWIEIGNPSSKRLHKASKSSRKVKVYTYKDPGSMLKEMADTEVHRREDIDVFAIKSDALEKLAEGLERDNRWSFLFNDGLLTVTDAKNQTHEIEIEERKAPGQSRN